MTFHLRNIKHLKTTVVGGVLIAGAIVSVFYPTEKPYATWAEASTVILLGAGFLGIGPSAKKEEPK